MVAASVLSVRKDNGDEASAMMCDKRRCDVSVVKGLRSSDRREDTRRNGEIEQIAMPKREQCDPV